ncbi:MAG: hypothetical protein JWM78_561 [Verrucomicrobiaceae bacterium]|nr:hypothetical protein [Verrucomicrobiaceae bacterium]
MKRLIAPLLYLMLAHTAHADEATRYVRDWMAVPLHEGPSAESRNVLPGLPSGTSLTLVQSEDKNGFSRVRTADGVEGWIATRYLMSEPTARIQLDAANNELLELRKKTTELNEQQANIPQDQRAAAQQLSQLKTENQRLQNELQTFQQAPDNATQLAQENIELKKDNETLHTQTEANNSELTELRRSKNFALFREGGLAVIAGALLTLLAAHMWPKKKSEWF